VDRLRPTVVVLLLSGIGAAVRTFALTQTKSATDQ